MTRQKTSPSQVRIIGGQWRGRKLAFDGGRDLRPTLGRTRETLFNWLRPHILNTRVLDLFAGSGALGFEALSQGAAYAIFVDTNSKTLAALKTNVSLLGINKNCSVIKADAVRYLQRLADPVDIVFLDPPFSQPELLQLTVALLLEQKLVRQFIYLESRDQRLIAGLAESSGISSCRQTRSGEAYAGLLEVSD